MHLFFNSDFSDHFGYSDLSLLPVLYMSNSPYRA